MSKYVIALSLFPLLVPALEIATPNALEEDDLREEASAVEVSRGTERQALEARIAEQVAAIAATHAQIQAIKARLAVADPVDDKGLANMDPTNDGDLALAKESLIASASVARSVADGKMEMPADFWPGVGRAMEKVKFVLNGAAKGKDVKDIMQQVINAFMPSDEDLRKNIVKSLHDKFGSGASTAADAEKIGKDVCREVAGEDAVFDAAAKKEVEGLAGAAFVETAVAVRASAVQPTYPWLFVLAPVIAMFVFMLAAFAPQIGMPIILAYIMFTAVRER